MENILFKIWDGNPIVTRAQGLKREAHARNRPRKPTSLFSKTYRYLRNAVGGRVRPQFPASLCDGAHQAPFVILEPSRRTEATPRVSGESRQGSSPAALAESREKTGVGP